MKVLLEDTWGATDIINYCKDKNIECIVLSESDLMKREDFFESIYFCSTDIISKKLEEKGRLDLIPDTYDKIYTDFYHRTINKVMFSDIIKELDGHKEIFVKPVTNNKLFDGKVITSMDDFEMFGETAPSLDTYVYRSDVVEILSEARLLIGNGRLYGHSHISKQENDSYLKNLNIEKLIELTGDKFVCIDIGMIPSDKWIIIEINPPYALDDYQIPLENYMEFCIDACKYINVNEIRSKIEFT